jgi:cyclopropane-fatty-acyl-phospholipid synthase
MPTMRIADAFTQLLTGPLPLRVTAYDGSSAGPEDAPFGLEVRNERGLSYLMTAPGDLGLGRAYVSGDLGVTGVHPGDPYEGLKALQKGLKFRMPTPTEALRLARGLGLSHLRPPAPPP